MCTSEGVSGLSECDCVCVRLPACCNHCPGHGAPALTSSPCSVPDNKNIAIRHSPSGTPVFPPTSPLRHRGVTPMPCLRAPPPYPPWFLPQGVRERERGGAPRHTHAHTVQDLHLSSTAHRESWHARTTPHRQLTGWTVVACCCPAPVNTLVGNRTPTAGPCLLL